MGLIRLFFVLGILVEIRSRSATLDKEIPNPQNYSLDDRCRIVVRLFIQPNPCKSINAIFRANFIRK